MADAFLQWRARKVMAKLDRQGRSCGGLSLRAVEAKEMQMKLMTRSGRRVGCSCRGQQRQDACGAWQRKQATDDECHPRGVHCLMAVSYCSSHSDNWNRLTARLQHVNTAKPLIQCKNNVHENCRPAIHLQLLFKDHHLIHHGLEVTSSQRWLDPTEIAVRT